MKTCPKCTIAKPRTEFYRNRAKRDGLQGYCKPCFTEAHRKSYLKHQAARYRRTVEWRKENPARVYEYHAQRRARKSGSQGQHTAEQREARFEYFGHKCLACGATDNLTADHNIPLARGGSDWASNLIPLCARCNSTKHTKTLAEFLG